MKLFTTSTLLGIASLFAFFLFSGLECNNNSEDPNPNCNVFKDPKATWRPTPIDDQDQPLNPAENFEGHVGTNNSCLYYYSFDQAGQACLKEAIIFTIKYEIKEEFKDQVYNIAGFIKLENRNEIIPVENFSYNIQGDIYYATGNLTISGNTYYSEKDVLSCHTHISILQQTDTQTTHNVFNNMVISITLDWAYTEW